MEHNTKGENTEAGNTASPTIAIDIRALTFAAKLAVELTTRLPRHNADRLRDTNALRILVLVIALVHQDVAFKNCAAPRRSAILDRVLLGLDLCDLEYLLEILAMLQSNGERLPVNPLDRQRWCDEAFHHKWRDARIALVRELSAPLGTHSWASVVPERLDVFEVFGSMHPAGEPGLIKSICSHVGSVITSLKMDPTWTYENAQREKWVR